MAITERKIKRPPTFPYHPKNRAKQLKKSWIENQKIKSQWKVQKKREELTKQPDALADEELGHDRDNTMAESGEDASQSHSDRQDEPPTPEPVPTPNRPSHDKRSLRELRKLAYSSNSPRAQKADPRRNRAPGGSQNVRGGKARSASHRGGQPNMKLRMNVLLEKIKCDFS